MRYLILILLLTGCSHTKYIYSYDIDCVQRAMVCSAVNENKGRGIIGYTPAGGHIIYQAENGDFLDVDYVVLKPADMTYFYPIGMVSGENIFMHYGDGDKMFLTPTDGKRYIKNKGW